MTPKIHIADAGEFEEIDNLMPEVDASRPNAMGETNTRYSRGGSSIEKLTALLQNTNVVMGNV